MKKFFLMGLCAALTPISAPVFAAPYPVIAQDVGVCDPNSPKNCAAPNSDGSISVKVVGGGGATSSTIVTNQAKIAVTGTAVQLQSASAPLVNGLALCAATGNNSTGITIGRSSVTNTVSGAGNGLILFPGQCAGIAISDANLVYFNGTAGDILSAGGN